MEGAKLNSNKRKVYQTFLLDYLKQNIENFQVNNKNGKNMFTCPLCKDHPDEAVTANLFPKDSYNVYCFDPSHKQLGDIFDMVKIFEPDMKDLSDDEIGEYLETIFDIKTDEKTNELLAMYHNLGWSLVPIAKGGKEANIEKEWQKKIHKNIAEWQDWLDASLNIGINCGLSGVTILDIDAMPSKIKKKWYAGKLTDEEKEEALKIKKENIEKALNILGNPETLSQESLGGIHLFFFNEPEIPKTAIELEGIHIDIETREGQVLLEPSIVDGEGRRMNNSPMIKMPGKIKELILSKVKTVKPQVKSQIINTDEELSFENLNGNRNNTFIHLYGKCRKIMPMKTANQVINFFNQLLDKQIPYKELMAMGREAEKYHEIDMEDLADKVIERLEKIEEATIRDLTYSLRQEQKDIEDVLRYLVDTDKIYKKGTKYKLFAKANWKSEFVDASKLLNFKVPYFDKYAVLRNSDMIVIGGKTGCGKSHLSLNIIKQLIDQGIHPNYISSEPGNRFAKIAMSLGLREGQFKWCNHYRPEQVELEDNAVTLVDWLLPNNYAETDKLYSQFAQQLDKHGGLLFIFTQLRKTGEFFAKDMIDFFASITCSYNLGSYTDKSGNVTYDRENTHFLTSKIRESRTGRQIIKIPTRFNKETNIVELRDE